MHEKNIKQILQTIIHNLKDKHFVWRLEGSANLKIQGLDVSVQDLDITTNNKGIKTFSRALKPFITKDFYNNKIKAHTLLCKINNFEIEINSYTNKELNMFDKIKKITWNSLEIPILPLEKAKKFYELINNEEKVDLLCKHLHHQPVP